MCSHFLINGIFYQLSIETRILKIGQYLTEIDNYNDFEKIFDNSTLISLNDHITCQMQSYSTIVTFLKPS